MKLFKTLDRNTVESCQEKFGFMLPSIELDKRRKKFEEKYMNTCDMYIGYIIPGDIYTVWPMFAKGTCLCVRIFVCVEIYSNLMIIVYS